MGIPRKRTRNFPMAPPPLSSSLLSVFYCVVALLLLLRFVWKRLKAIRNAGPGCSIIAVDPSHHLGFLLPNPQPGKIGTISEKFNPYARAGSLILPAASIATPRTIFFVADPELIKSIGADRMGTFEKDPQTYSVLHVYGKNIIGSDGPTWKKHREISRAAFSEANVLLAWKETCKVSRQGVEELRELCTQGSIDVTSFLKGLTLASTSASAFGRRIPYGKEAIDTIPPGYQLPFGDALRIASEHMVTLWATPKWAYKLPIPWLRPLLQRTALSYQELERHLRQLISESRASLADNGVTPHCKKEAPKDDLLRRLVEANTLEQDPRKRLSDEELLSDVFIFLVAGHETTAHTLSFILGHLALYPEAQEKVYEEVKAIWPDDESVLLAENSFQDSSKLVYTLAVFRESLRLFPQAPRLPKIALQDTVIHSRRRFASGPGSQDVTFTVPKGALVVMDNMATHHNPAYWGEDVEQFRPERFIDTVDYRWPRDAFLAFSQGVRSCIGQRSGQAQTLCMLAHIIRYYKVGVPRHLVGLPRNVQTKKLLRFWMGASLSPTDIRLTFSRRG